MRWLTDDLNFQNVTSVEGFAFYYCTGLTGDLNLQNVTSIGPYAFNSCKNLSGKLILSSDVTNIGSSAFMSCSNLTGELDLRNVTNLEMGAFAQCSKLTCKELNLQNVTNLSMVFWGCSGLKGKLTLSPQLTRIDVDTFNGCSGLTGELNLLNVSSLTGWSIFKNCGFTSVIIPECLEASEIRNSSSNEPMFGGCSKLTTVTINNASVAAALTAQDSCEGLIHYATTIRIKNGIDTVGSYVTEHFTKSESLINGYWEYTIKQ